jgi:hypothetical protein
MRRRRGLKPGAKERASGKEASSPTRKNSNFAGGKAVMNAFGSMRLAAAFIATMVQANRSCYPPRAPGALALG